MRRSHHLRKCSMQIASVHTLNHNLHPSKMEPFKVGSIAATHLGIRLSEEIKVKASALLGHKSLAPHVVRLMDKDTTQVIEQHESGFK